MSLRLTPPAICRLTICELGANIREELRQLVLANEIPKVNFRWYCPKCEQIHFLELQTRDLREIEGEAYERGREQGREDEYNEPSKPPF